MMKKLCGILLLIVLIAGCDSGSGRNNRDSCDPVQIPFSPIPECVTEFFQGHWIACDCEGVQGEFILELRNFDIDGFTGAIMDSNIIWEPSSCSSITFTVQTTGVLDDMTVPDDRTLNFTLTLEGSEPEQVSCCCNDQLIVD